MSNTVERVRSIVLLALLATGSSAAIGCDDDVPSARLGEWTRPRNPDAGPSTITPDGGEPIPPPGLECPPAVASDRVPAREAVITAVGSGENRGVFTSQLWNQFRDHCGACHTRGARPQGLDVTADNFPVVIDATVVARIKENNPALLMPPASNGGKPFRDRTPDDPIVRFVSLIEQWIAAGRPRDIFYPTVEGGTDGASGESPYQLTRTMGMQLTNLGHCIPDRRIVNTEMDGAAALDAKFAAMERFEDLPRSLRDTDLVTLDTARLARRGVIAFAPAYTLWADEAKKIRHVRVPVGTSIQFDAEKQHFSIPPNTRFYKTFLKRVVDLDGNVRYRKMETRIIVARPDRDLEGGEFEPTALFGTYKWNEDETEATLHAIPYKDGQGFTDDLEPYVVDERLEDQIVRSPPPDLDQALLEAGARRHYAIPGYDRCVNCHMGSPDKSFVLGFTPLQIKRLPLGESGVIEPAERDELNQLQRLIDYGVITGIRSPDEITRLEDSQGSRKPRNEHELDAQGYMLGNCAHCHNPRGFPSQREKVLAEALDFLPSASGGIFEFPLDRFSPRTFRGKNQDIRVPYITPSLYDHPVAAASNSSNDPRGGRGLKWIERLDSGSAEQGFLGGFQPAASNVYPFGELTKRESELAAEVLSKPGRPLLAPWRSLIYRNVDAPFSYEDGGAIFPHMPMDTPGYDCRARRVLGTWMVSIPSRRPRGTFYTVSPFAREFEEYLNAEDQPYIEVRPHEGVFDFYRREADARLARFKASERYWDCPDPDLDTVAPEVAFGGLDVPLWQDTTLRRDGQAVERYTLRTPERAHYPKKDLRDLPEWLIRRPDWRTILLENGVDPVKEAAGGIAAENSRVAIGVVRSLQITDALRRASLDPIPFGLWRTKPACQDKLASVPTVASYAGANRPAWMQFVNAPATAPVYVSSRGEQVFSAICSKCHGPLADGKSALASTIDDITGTATRVANLRDGIFGPLSDPGSNWRGAFASADGQLGGSVEDWAARYLVWMGLGGTTARIPETVLALVGSQTVLGEARAVPLSTITGSGDAANMLSTARSACLKMLPDVPSGTEMDVRTGVPRARRTNVAFEGLESLGFILENGDAELWRELCYTENPGPIRRIRIAKYAATDQEYSLVTQRADLFRREAWPGSQPIGDDRGRIVNGLAANNRAPWCVDVPAEPDFNQAKLIRDTEAALGVPLPRCRNFRPEDAVTDLEIKRWAARGAANAGVSVFLYINALAKREIRPTPAFDRCEDL